VNLSPPHSAPLRLAPLHLAQQRNTTIVHSFVAAHRISPRNDTAHHNATQRNTAIVIHFTPHNVPLRTATRRAATQRKDS